MWVDKEYYVRPVGHGYEVAVFENTKRPRDVYYVSGLYCSCPAGGHADRGHKHVELVRLFRQMNEPSLFAFWHDGEIWRARDCLVSPCI